jgi:hypothetical protein
VVRKNRQRGWSKFDAAGGAGAKAGKTKLSDTNPLFGASHKGVVVKAVEADQAANPMHQLSKEADTEAGSADNHNAKSKKQAKKEVKANVKEEAVADADVDDGEIVTKVDPQSGQNYYYNTVTQKTAWTRVEVQRTGRERGWSTLGSSGSGASTMVTSASANPMHAGRAGKKARKTHLVRKQRESHL